MMVDESDTTMAKERLNEAILHAEHVENINGLKTDRKKIEASWLNASKPIERGVDLDTRVVKLGVLASITFVLEAKTRGICEKKLLDMPLWNDWTRAKLPTALGGPRTRIGRTPQDTACAVTEKETEPQTEGDAANFTCSIWRTNEQENRHLQILTEDVREGGDGRLTVARKQQEEGSTPETVQGRNCSKRCRVCVIQLESAEP